MRVWHLRVDFKQLCVLWLTAETFPCVLLHTLCFVCFKLVLVIAVNWMEPQNHRFKVALQTEALFCVDLVIRSSSGWFSMVSVAKQQKHSWPLDPERKPRAMLVSAHSLGITTGRKQAEWTSSGVIDTALGLSARVCVGLTRRLRKKSLRQNNS